MSEYNGPVSVDDWTLSDVVEKIVYRFRGEAKVRDARVMDFNGTVGVACGPAEYVLVELSNGHAFFIEAREAFQ